MSENSEIQAKILEWQRRWNIADGDPAMALIELLNIYGYRAGGGSAVVAAPVSAGEGVPAAPQTVTFAGVDDAVLEQIRSQLLPAIDKLGFQTQELKQKIDGMALESFAQQVATYHEGIDYCTKKLDVVKKDADALVLQVAKVANSINPISRVAVIVLVLVAFVAGVIAAVIFHVN
ncbi:MAG: hypothetical protein ACREKL_07630 [Chthoniobacterales bacterium]